MNSHSSRLVSWSMTAFVLAVLTGVPSSRAAALWWDGGTTDIGTPGDAASGGNGGTWNITTLNWDQGSGLAHVAWVNANNDAAIFAGTAGTVTLGVPVTANALTFNTAGYTISSGSLTLAGTTPTLTVNANATISSIVAGSVGLTKTGTGTLTLNGMNTFTGSLTASQGWLILGVGNNNANWYAGKPNIIVNNGATLSFAGFNIFGTTPANMSAVTVNGGTVLSSPDGADRVTLLNNLTLNGGTLSINGSDVTYTTWGVFGFGGTTTATGTSVINALSGKTGTIRDGNGNTPTFSINTPSTTDTLTISVVMQNGAGALTLTKSGNGTLTLAAANTYTGTTTINAGTLRVNGSTAAGSAVSVASGARLSGTGTISGTVTLLSGATLAPGDVALGTLTLANTLTMNAGCTNLMRINRTGATLTGDKVSRGAGAITYAGVLTVTLNGTSDALQAGNTFTLFTAGSYSGSFSATNLPPLGGVLGWDASQLSVNGSIRVLDATVTVTPQFTPPAGGYVGAQVVTLNCNSPGATIYYTTDGSQPTTGSLSGPNGLTVNVPDNSTRTIRAFATAPGLTDSAEASATYGTVTTPTWITAAGGSWATGVNWQNTVIASGSGVTADFTTLSLPANATVTLDGARTIGTLLFNDQNSTKHAWTLNTGTGGTLTLAGGAPLISSEVAVTIGTVLAGSSGLTKAGAGALTLTGASGYTGATSVNAGTFILKDTTSFNSATTVNGGGTLQLNKTANGYANRTTVINRLISGTGTLTVNNTTSGINGGWVTFNAANVGLSSFNGTLNVNSGVLTMDNIAGAWVTSNPDLNVTSGGIFFIRAQSVSVDELNGNGDVGNNWNGHGAAGDTLTIGAANGSGTFTGVIHGSQTGGADGAIDNGIVNIIKTGSGTQALNGVNTYTGTTTINAGTLRVNGSTAAGSAVSVASGATLGGTGTINGTVTLASGATLAPGSTALGTLTLASTLTMNAGSTNMMRINRTGATLTCDKVNRGALAITYAGTLAVTLNGTSDALQVGNTFTLFAAGSYSGSFSATNLPSLGGALEWDVSQLSVDGTIRVIAPSVTQTPQFSPPAGGYMGAQVVTLNCNSPGATIYYTTDGSVPTTGSPSGSDGLTVNVPDNSTLTIRAFATAPGLTDSAEASASYATVTTPTWLTAAGGSWGAGVNWQNTVIANGSGVTADFTTLSLPADTTVTLDGARTIGILRFNDQNGTKHAWTLNAGTGGTLTLAGGAPLINNEVAVTIGTVLAGSSGLTKDGAGALTLTGVNTYGGGTTLGAGTISFANGALGASGSITMNGGALQWNGANVQDISARLALVNGKTAALDTQGNTVTLGTGFGGGTSGALVKIGVGTLILGGANTFTGATTVNGGTLTIGAGGAAGALSTGSSIDVGPGATIGFNRSDALTQGTHFSVGAITGGGGLQKAGAGTLTLNAANTYSGGTTLTAGALELGSAETAGVSGPLGQSAAANPGNISFAGGTLRYSALNQFDYSGRFSTAASQQYSVDTAGQSVIWATSLTSSGGTLGKSGAGTLTLNTGTSGSLGNITVSGGTLELSGASVTANTGVLSVNGGNVSMTGGAFSMGGGTTAAHYIGNASAGTWTQTGGTASFGPANGGTINIAGGAASGVMTISGGTLYANYTYGAAINVGSSSGAGTLTINGTGTVYGGYGITIGANGTVNLDVGGTLQLGRTGYSPGQVAGTGTLSFNGGTFTPMRDGETIANTVKTMVNNGGLIVNGGGISCVINSALAAGAGSGGLTKYGSAILTLGGTCTYIGATTVSAGTVKLDFSTATAPQNNIVSPSSTLVLGGGTLNITGKSAATHSQTFNGLSVSGGTSAIRVTQSGATSITLNLGTITQSAGGAVDFTLPTTGSITTLTPNGPGGFLGPWATIDGVNYAANDGLGNIIVYAGFVDISALGPSIIPDNAVTPKNVRINSVGTTGGITLGAATTTINSLLQNVTTGATITMAGQTLRTASVQINSGMQALTVGTPANDGVLTALTAGGELLLGNSGTLTLTVNSAIADNTSASALSKAGSGTVTLNGNNTYTGNTTIQAGTLMIGGAAKLNAGNYAGAIVNNGVLLYGSSASQTLGGNISGAGGITITTGTLTLNGNNTHTGGTTFSAAGTVMLGSATALGTGVVNTTAGTGALILGITGSSLTLANNNAFTTHARPFTFISAGTLNLGTGSFDTDNSSPIVTVTDPNGILTIGGQVWSSGGTWGITKNGAGKLVLSGNNTNNGGTTINAGTLSVAGGTALPNAAVVTLANPAGGATLNLASSETIGSLAGGGANGNVSLNANTLTLGDNSSQNFAGVISGSGGLVKIGTGTQTLSGANTYSGRTTVNGGVLILAHALAAQNSVISNTVSGLQFSGGTAFTVAGLAGNADQSLVNNASGTVTLSVGNNTTTASFGGGLTGGGALRKIGTGTQTLTGGSSYTGATTIDAGTLRINGSTAAGSAVSVASGATLGGTGTINGSVTLLSGATLAPGDAALGTLTLASTLTMNAGSTNAMRINRTGAITTGDSVNRGAGAITYAGVLTVTLNGTSDALQAGNTFTLFTAGSYGGSFSAINLPPLGDSLEWNTSQLLVDGTIRVAVPSVTQPPQFSPPAGGYVGAQVVTLNCSSPGATIYYTTDGSLPTIGSLSGSDGLTVNVPDNSTVTIRAIATAPGLTVSPEASATYKTVTTPTWITAAGGSWATGDNWQNTVIASGSGVTADFTTLSLPADATVTLDGARTIGILRFDDQNGTKHAWMLNTGTGGSLTLAGGAPLINNEVDVTIGTVLAGSSGLTKDGAGALTLTVANSYGGGTTINAGTISFVSGTLGASGSITMNGGALQWNGANVQDISARLALVNGKTAALDTQGNTVTLGTGFGGGTSGLLVKSGVGTLIFSGANTYTGATTVNGGTLTIGAGGAAGSLSTDSLIAVGPGATLGFNRSDALTQGTHFSGGAITGGGSLRKAGTGTLTLNAANTYTGGTTLTAGTLELGSAETDGVSGPLGQSAAANPGNITLAGGTLRYSALNQFDYSGRFSTAASQQYSVDTAGQSVIWATSLASSGGTLGKSGAGMLTLNAGTSGSLGNITVSGGTLELSGASVTANTGTLSVNGGNVAMSGGAFSIGGGSTAGHYIGNASAGTWTQTGGTANFGQINGGTINIAGGAASGMMTISGGTLVANYTSGASINVGSSSGTGTLTITGAGTVYCGYGLLIGANGTVNLDAGGTLQLGRFSYSNLKTTGTGKLIFNGGTLTPTAPSTPYIENTLNTIINAGGLIYDAPSGYNFTINSGLAAGTGSGGVTKYGANVLTLGGTCTYIGATTVNGGTLKLDFSVATAPQNNIVSPSSTLVLAGGTTLNITGKSATTHSQSFNGLNVSGGATAIRVTQSGATSITLNLGSITQSAGGSVDFTLPTTGSITTSTPNGPGGIIGTWATIDGVNYAANDGAGNIIVYTGFVDISALGPSIIPDDPVFLKNVRINSVGTSGGITLGAATTTINSLLQNVTTAASVTMAAQTLRAGSLQINSGMQALTIGMSADDGVLTAATAGGELLLGNSSANTLTVNSAIADNTSASPLVKSGTGTVTLTGNNTYTGNTTIQAGTLMIGGTGKLNGGSYAGAIVNSGAFVHGGSANQILSGNMSGTGSILLSGTGTLILSGNNTYSGGVSFSASATRKLTLGSTTALGTGQVTVTGVCQLDSSVPNLVNANNNAMFVVNSLIFVGTQSLNLGTGTFNMDVNGRDITVTANNLTIGGNVIGGAAGNPWRKYGAGTLTLAGNNSVVASQIEVKGGVLRVMNGSAIPDSRCVSLDNTAGVSFNLASSETIGSLAGGGANGNVTLNANTLTTGGDNTSQNFAGVISGSGGLVKTGTGTQTLNGANTYSGRTTVNGGVLILAHALAAQNSVISNTVSGLQFSGGTAFTVAGLAGSADLSLINNASGTVTLSVGNNNTSASFGGALTGGGALRKIGSGTQTLTGGSSYTGATTIDAGTVRINGSTAAGSAVSVASGATLTGTGTAGGTVTVATGGHIAPGTGVGTITCGGLTLAASSVLDFEFDATPGNDQIVVTGNNGLIINGGGVNLYSNGTLVAWSTPGTNNLIRYTGTIGGAGLAALSVNNQAGGYIYSFITDGTWVQLVIAPPAGGAWTGTASGSWTNEANWGGTAPVAGDLLVFGAANAAHFNNTNDFAANTPFGGIMFTAEGAYTLTGAVVNLTGNVNNQLASNQTVNLDLVLDGAGRSVLVAAGGSVVANGRIGEAGGSQSLTKNGQGTLVLAGANTHSGGTMLMAGTLTLNHAGALGGGALAIAGGSTLDSSAPGVTLADHAESWNGDFAFAGTTNLNLGGGAVALAASRQVTVTGNSLTVGGPISGAGCGLTKAGAGTLTLVGTCTYSGNTTINDGTLQIGTNSASGSIPGDIANQGALVFNRSDTVTQGGVISGSGSVVKAGAGMLTFNLANSYGGGTTIDAGTLSFVSGALGASGSITMNGGALQWNGANTEDLSARLAMVNGKTATLDLQANTVTLTTAFGGGTTGSLVRNGSGALILTGNNTYTGNTTVNSGTLQIGAGGATGAVAGGIINNGVLVFNRSGSLTIPGPVSGSGPLIQNGSGTVTLSGANSYAGATTNSAGTLVLDAANTCANSMTLGGGTLTLNANNSISNSAALILGAPAGANVVVAMNVNGNATVGTLTAQMLSLAGTASTIRIAAGKTLAVNGNFWLGSGAAQANQYKLTVSGAGALVVTKSGGEFRVGGIGGLSGGVLDMSGLGTFTANLGNSGTLFVGTDSTYNGGQAGQDCALTLAANSTITAGMIALGWKDLASTTVNETLALGTGANTLNVDNIYLGQYVSETSDRNHNAVMQFFNGSGRVTIRNAAGTGRANLYVGNVLGAFSQVTGTVNLNNHAADLLLGTVVIGNNGGGGYGAFGSMLFNSGTMDVSGISIGVSGGGGTLTLGGGTVAVGAAGIVVGSGTGTATLNLTGGTVTLGGDITRSGGTGTVTLDGATLDMGGHNLGGATAISALTFNSGTLMNVAQINNGAGLVKTGAGTLALGGANTYTGGTTVSNGTLNLCANGAIRADGIIVLAGGTLGAGAYANTVGTLRVSASSGLDISAGGVINFADSSGIAWAGPLTITGGVDASRIRFGTNAAGLTAGQVSAITWDGERVKLDDEGYLVRNVRVGTVFRIR